MASMKLYETFANEYMRDIIKMIVAHHKDYNIPLYYLSQNYNVTWEIIQENPDINWQYDLLSDNPNITWQIVKDNPLENWD